MAQGHRAFSEAANVIRAERAPNVSFTRRLALPFAVSLALLTLTACGGAKDEDKPRLQAIGESDRMTLLFRKRA